jgi:hypothetical protein
MIAVAVLASTLITTISPTILRGIGGRWSLTSFEVIGRFRWPPLVREA